MFGHKVSNPNLLSSYKPFRIDLLLPEKLLLNHLPRKAFSSIAEVLFFIR
jgi:hypothetical protein